MDHDRAERARASHVPVDNEKLQLALAQEKRVAEALGGTTTKELEAEYDVVWNGYLIEVKTIVKAKHDKITVHPESLKKKLLLAEITGMTPMTVVFDKRAKKEKIYYKSGVGSYRLSTMFEVSSLREMKNYLEDMKEFYERKAHEQLQTEDKD